METLNTIIVITGIIQIVTLICFFILVSDVNKIKGHLKKDLTHKDYITKFHEEKFIGNFEKAKEYLLRAEFRLHEEMDTELSNSAEYYQEQIKSDYSKKIEYVEKELKALQA